MSNVIGVGIDLVSISEIKDLNERTKGAFVKKTYTEKELELASSASNYYEFLAGRFAVKEAVYKAIVPIFPRSACPMGTSQQKFYLQVVLSRH